MELKLVESELKLYKDSEQVDDIYWHLSRTLLLRIFGRNFYGDTRDNFLLAEIDIILKDISGFWRLKYPLERLDFGLQERAIEPFLKVSINKIYRQPMEDLARFYSETGNLEGRINGLRIIFEVRNE